MPKKSSTMSMKAQESSVSHNHLPYLCSAKETWLRPQKQTSYSSFKNFTVMNKTVKTILQAISYLITLILGAAGGAAM